MRMMCLLSVNVMSGIGLDRPVNMVLFPRNDGLGEEELQG